jgi:hypothetical protein
MYVSKKKMMAMLVLLLAVFAFFFTFAVVACDDDDDDSGDHFDDDDDDDDSNDDDDDSSLEPGVFGWVATTRAGSYSAWGSLFRVEGDEVISVPLPDDEALLVGNAVNAELIWASNYDDVIQWRDSQWQPVVPTHPCGDGGPNKGAVVPQVFGESSGVALCTPEDVFYSFDGAAWKQEAEQVGDYFCDAANHCLFVTGYDMHLWDGESATVLAGSPGYARELLFSQGGRPIAAFEVFDGEDPYLELWIWQDGAWAQHPAFGAGQPLFHINAMVPVDENEFAICLTVWGESDCYLISEGATRTTGWPAFRRLTFATSGSANGLGVAADGDEWVLYRIVDEEATAIFELPENETPTGFLVAADAD